MHLFLNHVPPKVVQTYMGHERYESTEQYLKVFALDVAPQLGIHFSLDAEPFRIALQKKNLKVRHGCYTQLMTGCFKCMFDNDI